MEGFIEAGFEHLEPLLEFRDWLAGAALHDIELLRVGAFTEVLVATKRSNP